jgi:hypothetical protein
MDFLPKHFCRVFELPLPRTAQKRTKKSLKKYFGVGWFLESQSNIRRGPSCFFFSAPCKQQSRKAKTKKRGGGKINYVDGEYEGGSELGRREQTTD